VSSRQWAGKTLFSSCPPPTADCPLPPAVSFLLHFPSDCSASMLSSTVPCAARTFLTRPRRTLSKPIAGNRSGRARLPPSRSSRKTRLGRSLALPSSVTRDRPEKILRDRARPPLPPQPIQVYASFVYSGSRNLNNPRIYDPRHHLHDPPVRLSPR